MCIGSFNLFVVLGATVAGARASRAPDRHDSAIRLSLVVDLHVELQKQPVQPAADWGLPPWSSPISEGSDQAVAIVCGQSLKPDGSAPQVLVDRVKMAKELLDDGRVSKVVVSGGDPAGVGRTEASVAAELLAGQGVAAESIIEETQAGTTAENAWFLLRELPMGTGKVYLVTSDFHMARATYIFKEVFDYFYGILEDTYRDDPRWTSTEKKYPRLQVLQAPTQSFCGGNADLNRDNNPGADINEQSLAKRAKDELGFLGSGEVAKGLFGEPLSTTPYISPLHINVAKDPENKENFEQAMAQAMEVADQLCICVAPPEQSVPELTYPLNLSPIPMFTAKSASGWNQICTTIGH